LSLVAVLAATVIAIGLIRGNADSPDELKIQLSQLRSQAGELALLTEQRDHLPSAFVSAQGAQLLKKIDSTRADLEALRLEQPTLQAVRDQAVRQARTLAARVSAATH